MNEIFILYFHQFEIKILDDNVKYLRLDLLFMVWLVCWIFSVFGIFWWLHYMFSRNYEKLRFTIYSRWKSFCYKIFCMSGLVSLHSVLHFSLS